MITKRCPRCELHKPSDEFYKANKAQDGLQTYCKSCQTSYEKERYGGSRKPGARKRYYMQTYGLTLDELEEMYAAQDGKCAICGAESELVVDHCHSTERVRGLLCHTCNRSLGLLKDNVDILMSAAAYIISHEDVLTKAGE